MERPAISSTGFRTAFVLILVLAVSALFLAVIWPFFKPLLLGALLASLCGPLFTWILRLVRGRRSLATLLTLLILFLLVVGPLSAFVGVVVSQAMNVSEHAIPWVQQHFGAASTFNLHDMFFFFRDGSKIIEKIFYYMPLGHEDEDGYRRVACFASGAAIPPNFFTSSSSFAT